MASTVIDDPRVRNAAYFDSLESGADDGSIIKSAAVTQTNELIRTYAREGAGIMRSVLGSSTITNDDLLKHPDHPVPVVVRSRTPGSLGAVTRSYYSGPEAAQMTTDRFVVPIQRLFSRLYYIDLSEFRNATFDVRDFFRENAVRDLTDKEDSLLMSMLDAVVGAAGSTNPMTGGVHHITLGSFTRAAFAQLLPAMTALSNRLVPKIAVCNYTTACSLIEWTRDELGGDMAQQLITEGLPNTFPLLGLDWVVTVKDDIVPDDAIYALAPRENVGCFLELVEPTAVFKRPDPWRLELFIYSESGGAIANVGGVIRGDTA